jgi:hypothetical protein
MLTASSKTKADPPPKLDTVEDIELPLRRSQAVMAEAECQLKHQAVERGRLEISKRRVLLWFGVCFLVLALIVCGVGVAELLQHPELLPAPLLVAGGGGSLLSTILATWIRSGEDKPESPA